MSPDATTSCIGMEYFCFEGDRLWRKTDSELLAQAREELGHLGLIPPAAVVDGAVVRVPKAYPVYDDTYKRGLAAVQTFLEGAENLQMVGRNGMHRYNNQDHSMLTALMAARNVLGAKFDLWRLHSESEYLEEGFELTDEDIELLNESQPQTPYMEHGLGAQQRKQKSA